MVWKSSHAFQAQLIIIHCKPPARDSSLRFHLGNLLDVDDILGIIGVRVDDLGAARNLWWEKRRDRVEDGVRFLFQMLVNKMAGAD